MKNKYLIWVAVFLGALNFFAWQEVFVLQGPAYLKVDFLSVGQGDAEFIKTPQGHKILIDGGPDSTVLAKLDKILPFWDREIDAIILTHPEKDHMTGILEVLERYKVKNFLWTGVVKKDAEDRKLAELLKKVSLPGKNFFLAAFSAKNPTKIITVNSGQRIKAGNAKIDILFPLENLAGKEIKNTSNDTGVVARLAYGKSSFLFTGDISDKAEKQLVEAGGRQTSSQLSADVLKVAHHGSKYSSSDLFLESVAPKIAVIEVGQNKFGHPTPETLQRLEKYGIKVLRTDQLGDILITSDGNNIYLK